MFICIQRLLSSAIRLPLCKEGVWLWVPNGTVHLDGQPHPAFKTVRGYKQKIFHLRYQGSAHVKRAMREKINKVTSSTIELNSFC